MASGSWWMGGRLTGGNARPDDLIALADRCERLAADEQRFGFELALRLMGEALLAPSTMNGDEGSLWVGLLADSGAYESAALALLPPDALYGGERLAEETYTAHVTLPGGAAAHSRGARSLAMAWLAALFRALARDIIMKRGLH
ncbi:hypothetical protein [Novosphingobium pituita]|nr:hypothetical protein [Novosphingobium sp. IK01]MDK4807584.1 hypothetical protein [Novosphingobium aromaticivorans]HIQ19042.1 hypothetical protein [Novosphingobium capsulatum]